jgi:hypothetical protein
MLLLTANAARKCAVWASGVMRRNQITGIAGCCAHRLIR